jgi:ATP/maltotriose-dependent transcriptional regulator MalT
MWVTVSFTHGLGADARALQTALEHERPNSSAAATYQATAVAAVIAGWTGELPRARDEMAAVQRHYTDRGSEIDILWAAEHAVTFDVWSGRFADASRTAEEALQRAEQMGGGHVLIKARTGVAAVASYTGDLDVARAAVRAAIDAAVATGGHYMALAPTSTPIFVEVSAGNYGAALAVAEPLLAQFDAAHDTEIVVGAWLPDAIEALTASGRADDAESLVEALERNGIHHDRPWMLAMGARGRGHLLAARGELDGAQLAVEQAMVHHRRLPMPFEEARSRLLLGQLQRRGRRRQAAAASLREALDTFEQLGTPLWAARARNDLARLDTPRGDGQGLTSAEQRAAALAATGLSNKQIAAELFIAEKTVEMNLSRTYRKLGIRSRAQLSAALRNDDVQGNP